MEKTAQLGTNRTGIDMSPIHSKKMIEASKNAAVGAGDGQSLYSMQFDYVEEGAFLGSVPLPGTAKGALKSILKMAQGRNPEMLINKLGERLAFERSGVRIYEHLIIKCNYSRSNGQLDIPEDRLQEFRDQEAEHFALLVECLEWLGADPTAQTPDADASGIAASGLMSVIMDPRTSLSQSLEAMLSVELTDNAAWDLLIKLAEDMGLSDMAQKFGVALQQENVHLDEVRQWYEQSVREQATSSLRH